MKVVALSLASFAAIGCSSSPRRSDAADGPCDPNSHGFAATPVPPDAGAPPCTFTLIASDPNGDLMHIAVLTDAGTVIAHDTSHRNGWDYVSWNQIQIWGPTCDAITAGTVHTVCVDFIYISDRDAKRDFEPVDRGAILERLSRLPISTWRYKTDAQGARHIGPMAQDFKLSFDVGPSDKTIFPLDESGVAFAAIQALDLKIKRLEEENARLQKQVAALRARRR